MRVCFVSKEVAGLRGGGIGTYVAEAGKALAAHGHEVWLITMAPPADRRHVMESLAGFHRVLVAGEGVPPAERREFRNGAPHYAWSFLVHQTLAKLDVDFDYVEFPDFEAEGLVAFQEDRAFGTYGSTALGLMLHSPTWECLSSDRQVHRMGTVARQACSLEEEAIRIAPMIASPSRGLRDQVLARLGIERDVAIVRYPMDLPAEHPAPPAPRESLADLRFLYYGRIEPRKGVEELVAAFRELPDLRLTLIGGDEPFSPYGTSFREHVAGPAPRNVEFQDALPRPELQRRIAEYDVCIFPSLFENWPNACIEAMAAGRVVIGSRHGGMAEMIEDGVSGFHVDGRAPADIVRVVREGVGGSLSRLDAIGRAAAARIRALSDPKVFCDALGDRVRSHAATRRPRPPVDHESHKVSVVIPFHRDRDTIDEAVDSARAQTQQNLEILIVDDGSPLVDAGEILDRQAAKDPRVRVLGKDNGGLSSARNHAIEHATGEFLLFLDADNSLRPDYARTGVDILARHPDSVFVVPNVGLYDGASGRERGVYNPLPFDRATCLVANVFGDAGAFFRRSVFTEHGMRYDELLSPYADWALWMDVAGAGLHGERVPRVLYDYRVRADSMLHVDGLPNYRAMMGLLIQRHHPNASEGERAALTTIFEKAAESIAGPPPLRHKVVDELSRLSRKLPVLNRALRAALSAAQRLARRHRDQR